LKPGDPLSMQVFDNASIFAKLARTPRSARARVSVDSSRKRKFVIKSSTYSAREPSVKISVTSGSRQAW
jgi:hypothetical protein